MHTILQGVIETSVEVDDKIVGEISSGFLILFCAMVGNKESITDQLLNKISKLRIFADENGKMNHSLLDVEVALY